MDDKIIINNVLGGILFYYDKSIKFNKLILFLLLRVPGGKLSGNVYDVPETDTLEAFETSR